MAGGGVGRTLRGAMKSVLKSQWFFSAAVTARVAGLASLAVSLFVGGEARAQTLVVVGPVAIVSNTMGGAAPNLFDQRNVGYANGVTDFATFVASSPSGGAYWNTDVFVPTGAIVFDLGSSMTLGAMALWQGSHFYSQDVQQYRLSISDDPTFATGVTDLGGFFPAIEPALPSVNYFGLTPGRYVRWEVVSNYGNGFGTHGFEVAFGATAIPEPSTWAAAAGAAAWAAAWVARRRTGRGRRVATVP